MPSYATQRKIKIIEDKFGPDWRTLYPGASIDRMYNVVIGDQRKNLFCKVDPEVKTKLDEMVDTYDIDMAELVERMIEHAWENFETQTAVYEDKLATQFSKSIKG